MPDTDPYSILQLPRGSSPQEIQQQYRRLARIYHPDRNPRDASWCEEQLKELNLAFSILSDPAAKAKVDGSERAQKDTQPSRQAPTSSERPASTYQTRQQTRTRTKGASWGLPVLCASVAAALTFAFLHATSHQTPALEAPHAKYGAHRVSKAVPTHHPDLHHLAIADLSRPRYAAHDSPPHLARHRMRVALRKSQPHAEAERKPIVAPENRHSAEHLSEERKTAVALALAEQAEARGRAETAAKLQRRGITVTGMNLAQMRRVDQEVR